MEPKEGAVGHLAYRQPVNLTKAIYNLHLASSVEGRKSWGLSPQPVGSDSTSLLVRVGIELEETQLSWSQ